MTAIEKGKKKKSNWHWQRQIEISNLLFALQKVVLRRNKEQRAQVGGLVAQTNVLTMDRYWEEGEREQNTANGHLAA